MDTGSVFDDMDWKLGQLFMMGFVSNLKGLSKLHSVHLNKNSNADSEYE